ncbi:DUF5671 domain-containing protein [Luteimonas sp. MJ293]|uniref:DUF5671 domain-containing protein n=1 Tax=Luteimonas sp. MJ146 TaxID=3129240 RepID=UPI0031BB45BA
MAVATQELDLFVREALARGASKEEIVAALDAAGWDRVQVDSALGAWADVPFAVPVPRPRPYLSAREVFLYLLMFATLYLSAWHVGSLLFDLINLAFPDAADGEFARGRLDSSMRWSIAGVVIAFPVFVFVARRLAREVADSPVRRLSAVRRWLTYLTLFFAASVLIGDMIVLVYSLLGGGLSARFLLKVLVVAAIAGTVFGWYLQDLRREERQAPAAGISGRMVLGAAAVVILVTLVASVAVIRSPASEREARLDTRRAQDLARITGLVEAHYHRTGALPVGLDDLATPGIALPLDPVDGSDYVYEVTGERDYRLCARFVTDTARDQRQPWGGDAWRHGVGQHCFDLRAAELR